MRNGVDTLCRDTVGEAGPQSSDLLMEGRHAVTLAECHTVLISGTGPPHISNPSRRDRIPREVQGYAIVAQTALGARSQSPTFTRSSRPPLVLRNGRS